MNIDTDLFPKSQAPRHGKDNPLIARWFCYSVEVRGPLGPGAQVLQARPAFKMIALLLPHTRIFSRCSYPRSCTKSRLSLPAYMIFDFAPYVQGCRSHLLSTFAFLLLFFRPNCKREQSLGTSHLRLNSLQFGLEHPKI